MNFDKYYDLNSNVCILKNNKDKPTDETNYHNMCMCEMCSAYDEDETCNTTPNRKK
jgi:hypothetical protein